MAWDKSVSIKAYMDLGGGRQEVRRFGLDEGAATSFTCLKEKTRSVFALGDSNIIISWKDAEGDEIVISSDEELMEALIDSLTRQNLPLLRIFISTNTKEDAGPNASAPGSEQGPTHSNVICDGCDGPIQGYRYRCMTCPDFDLCAACEHKGLHQHHKMVRLPVPEPKGAPRFWWSEQQGPPGHFTAQFGVQTDQGGSTSFSTSGGGGGCNSSAWTRGGGRGRRGKRHGGAGWGMGWFGGRHPGPGFFPQEGDESPKDDKEQGKSHQSQHQHQHQKHHHQHQQHHQQHQQHHQQHHQQFQQQQQPGQQQQQSCSWVEGGVGGWCPFMGIPTETLDPQRIQEEAQNIAQEAAQQASEFASRMASDHVANIMKGIWTAWSGQQTSNGNTGGPTQSCSFSSSSSNSCSHSASDSGTKEDGPAGGSSHGEVKGKISSDAQKTPEVVEIQSETEDICSPEGMQTDDVSSNAENEETNTPAAENVAKPSHAGSSKSKDDNVESDMSSDNEDWMMVTQNAEQKSSAPPEDVIIEQPHPENKSNSPKKDAEPKPSPIPAHPDPKIRQALEHLESMGYHNENGWLTNLVAMKNGDINQVLDMLLPTK
ncbi:refractory to sigma P isoform X2 [Oratosquilla oratoria]|uniref:refractory to sigma P isoform X2 n=1 Tax=Oratosquilla oratoria TaxID=337810 RepID=UPI003F764505